MKHLVLTLALLPTLVLAHNIKESTQVPLVNIGDKGELVLKDKEVSYQPWQSKVTDRQSLSDTAYRGSLQCQGAERPHDRGDQGGQAAP